MIGEDTENGFSVNTSENIRNTKNHKISKTISQNYQQNEYKSTFSSTILFKSDKLININ